MYASFNRARSVGVVTVFDVDVRHGHDWRLAVQASKAASLRVFVQWAGGKRRLFDDVALGADVVDVELGRRIAGERIIVECNVAAGGTHVSASMTWTPDPGGEAMACSCGC